MDKDKLIFIISVILIPAILFTANIRSAAFNPKFYKSETEKNLIHYLKHPASDKMLISEFSKDEQSHLKEVQNLFLLNTSVLAAALVMFTALLPRIKIKKTLVFGGILTAVLTAVLIILFLNFDASFAAFHHIFFTGNWQFPQESLLIKLFPIEFFTAKAKQIIINTFISAAAITGAGILLFFKP